MPMTSASQMKARAKPSPSSLSPRQPVQPDQAMAGSRASQMRGSAGQDRGQPCHHTRAPSRAEQRQGDPLPTLVPGAGTSRHSGNHRHALTGRP